MKVGIVIDFSSMVRENVYMTQQLKSGAESGISSMKSVESNKLIVSQPAKLQELNNILQTFESFNARVSERTGEDRSGDMGGGGGQMTGGSGQGDDTQVSPRDAAIARMPTEAKVLQKELSSHIRKETRKLERLAERVSRSTAPGSAHKLNVIYGKIRRLNSLVSELLESSLDVLKRLFIRVFIDKQPIL